MSTRTKNLSVKSVFRLVYAKITSTILRVLLKGDGALPRPLTKSSARIPRLPWHKWPSSAWRDSSKPDSRPSPDVIRHLKDAVQYFRRRCVESPVRRRFRLLFRPLFRLRSRDRFDQRCAIEGVNLVERHNRYINPLHISGGAMGPRNPITTSEVIGAWGRPQRSTSRSRSAGSRGWSRYVSNPWIVSTQHSCRVRYRFPGLDRTA